MKLSTDIYFKTAWIVLIGILVTSSTEVYYPLVSNIMSDNKAEKIYSEVHQTFPEPCRVKFTKEVSDTCMSTTLSRAKSAITVHNRWKENGIWDSCSRGERV